MIGTYTAWRIGCTPELLETPGTHVVPSVPGQHKWLMDPIAATEPDAICLFRLNGVSILRTHVSPSPKVREILDRLPANGSVSPADIEALIEGECRRYGDDPYFYLGKKDFRPVDAEGIRRLNPDDNQAMERLHEAIDPGIRWYVEIDHPIVFGLFSEGELVSVASHFLFDEYGIAAAGVLTHPEYRRRGFGTAVVSAAIAWALERDYIVEWITNESNLGSLGIARRVGFRRYAAETEFRIGARSAR